MINAVTSSDKYKKKECLLCERIIQELLPLDKSYDIDLEKIKEKIPSSTHLQMFQVKLKQYKCNINSNTLMFSCVLFDKYTTKESRTVLSYKPYLIIQSDKSTRWY